MFFVLPPLLPLRGSQAATHRFPSVLVTPSLHHLSVADFHRPCVGWSHAPPVNPLCINSLTAGNACVTDVYAIFLSEPYQTPAALDVFLRF